MLRGESKDNPVLLWVDGGPSGTEIGYTRHYLHELEKSFVFVNWDQRETGKSFNAIKNKNELKVEDIIMLKLAQRTLPDKNIRVSRRICSLSLVHPCTRLLFKGTRYCIQLRFYAASLCSLIFGTITNLF